MPTIRTVCTQLVLLACMALSLPASAACYQLFDKKDRLVLQSMSPPVDLSKSISAEVGRLYPGHYLIMAELSPCSEVDELDRPARAAGEVVIREFAPTSPDYGDRPYALPSRPASKGYKGTGSYPGAGSYSGTGSYLGTGSYAGSSDRLPPGTDVSVRSYTRRDGTTVRAHTRSSPKR